jgi:hypothetical protein
VAIFERLVPTGRDIAPDSLCFDVPGNALWAATTDGAIIAVRLLDGEVREVGAGYANPVAALPSADGLTVAVVERAGGITLARRDDASRDRASALAR